MIKIFLSFLKEIVFSFSVLFYRLFKYDPNKRKDSTEKNEKIINLEERIKKEKYKSIEEAIKEWEK